MSSDNGEDEASLENLTVRWGKRKMGGKRAREKAQEGMGRGSRRLKRE